MQDLVDIWLVKRLNAHVQDSVLTTWVQGQKVRCDIYEIQTLYVSFEMKNTCILLLISRLETWITQKVSKISALHDHHSITFSKRIPMFCIYPRFPNNDAFMEILDEHRKFQPNQDPVQLYVFS